MEVEAAPGDINISALGRPLFLGDIYYESTNTFSNQGVLNMWLDLLPETKQCKVLNEWNQTYFFRQPELCKWLHLGIDIHQLIFLRNSAITESQLWFSEYINHCPPEGWAHITIHFGFQGCRISVADVHLLLTMVNTKVDPTAYVVNEILYGLNSLLILEEPIGSDETKESVEDRLFLVAKRLAERAQDIVIFSDSIECRFYSDLPGETPITGALTECFSKVEEILSKMEDSSLHIPVKATLTPLSIEVTCRPSSNLDNALYVSTMIQNLISDAQKDLFCLIADPLVQRTKRMHPYLMHFRDCLNQLSFVNSAIVAINEPCRKAREECVIRLWQTHCAKRPLTEWLIHRRRSLAIMNRLLRNVDLPFLAKAELPDLAFYHIRKIFMLKTVKKKDPILEQFCLEFGQPESPEWSTLEIVSSTEDHIDHVRCKLLEFAAETVDGTYVERFISTSSYHEDAQIVTESLEISDEDLNIRGTRLLKRGNPSVYLLQAEKRIDVDRLGRWFDFGSYSSKFSRHRTLLLMGASGSGKSTLVDSIVNYILNVQWIDPFRFRVDPEGGDKQTKLVTAYTMHYVDGMSIPYTLTIIDTPGYNGDLESDIQLTQLITNFLTHENSRKTFQTIDAICLVADSTQKIASSAQVNVIEAVKFLFAGCDYARKAYWYCTFASNPKKLPVVLETIAPYIFPTDLHYEFENSILFVPKRVRSTNETEEDYVLGQTYWDKAWNNHRSFFSQWNFNEPSCFLSPTVNIATKSICVGLS